MFCSFIAVDHWTHFKLQNKIALYRGRGDNVLDVLLGAANSTQQVADVSALQWRISRAGFVSASR
jgi:hypothetical protein